MFDRDSFIAYVGDKSGSSYASGLKSIEGLYAVGIDEAYDTYQCASLLLKIEQDKKRTDLTETELHKRRDYASHLNKYRDYRLDKLEEYDPSITTGQWRQVLNDPNVTSPQTLSMLKMMLELGGESTSLINRNDLKILLNAFGGVEASTDFTGDFSRCAPDRTMKDYSAVLPWCRVFLTGKSFSSFSGSEVALALLFPMETLFESFVAAQLRKKLAGTDFTISIQDKSYHLFDTPQSFQLKPDIVVTRKSDRAVFVLDTKWKLLSPKKTNYGISQQDIYQMFVYQKRCRVEHVTLLYPMTELLPGDKIISFSSSDGVTVKVHQIDLFDVPNSIATIVNNLRCAREC